MQLIRKIIEKFVRNFTPELRFDSKSLRYALLRRAVESSADFIEENLLEAQPFEPGDPIYRYLLSRVPEEGLFLEFGVHNGRSINAIARMTDRIVHGFDSFQGLPDDGLIPGFKAVGTKWFAGKMSTGGRMPSVEENVVLHEGWFYEVLPGFLKKHDEKIAFMHVDCDIYSSTKTVLDESLNFIVPGTIILFDEYLNFDGWQAGEHKALLEFAEKTGATYDFIAYSYAGAVAICIKSVNKGR